MLDQEIALAFGLDALGNDLQTQIVTQGDHRSHDLGIACVALDTLNEGLVDLYLIDGQPS